MAARSNNGVWLAVLIGALVAAIAVVGYTAYMARKAGPELPRSIDVDINVPRPPAIPDAPKLPDPPIPIPK